MERNRTERTHSRFFIVGELGCGINKDQIGQSLISGTQ